MDTNEAASSEPRKKRRKVQQACTACRGRKTRCDGRQPICLACESRGVGHSCRYEAVSHPESRISAEAHSATESLVPLGRNNKTPAPGSNSRSLSGATISPSSIVGSGSQAGTSSVQSYTPAGELFGPSSNVTFSRSLVPNIAQQQGYWPKSKPNDTDSAARHEHKLTAEATQAVLPLRRNADDFVRCYFDFLWPPFPVLHHSTFMQRYERLWSGHEAGSSDTDGTEEQLFLCILNLVFALGCNNSELIIPEQRSRLAKEFYLRSRTHCPLFDLDVPQISAVQALLLTSIYLQSTDASRLWHVSGLAFRMAQGLGLQVEPRYASQYSEIELRVRRCVWHTCVHLDRLTAMGFGRPMMLPGRTILPPPVSRKDIHPSSHENGNLGLFVESIEMFDILHDVLQTFYPSDGSSAPGREDTEALITHTLGISRRLDRFQNSIPVYLRASDSIDYPREDKYTVLHLQRHVLYCRFLYVRLLTLRPLFMRTIQFEASEMFTSSLETAVVLQSCKDCLTTAERLVSILHRNLDTPYQSTGWHSVYFAFGAGTILLAAWQSESFDPGDGLEPAWQQCLGILNAHGRHIESGLRASEVLEAMRRKLTRSETNGVIAAGPTQAKGSSQDGVFMDEVDIQLRARRMSSSYINTGEGIGDFDLQALPEGWFDQFIADMDWLEPLRAADAQNRK